MLWWWYFWVIKSRWGYRCVRSRSSFTWRAAEWITRSPFLASEFLPSWVDYLLKILDSELVSLRKCPNCVYACRLCSWFASQLGLMLLLRIIAMMMMIMIIIWAFLRNWDRLDADGAFLRSTLLFLNLVDEFALSLDLTVTHFGSGRIVMVMMMIEILLLCDNFLKACSWVHLRHARASLVGFGLRRGGFWIISDAWGPARILAFLWSRWSLLLMTAFVL